jgi:recombinational DNA repair protein (RecF pathway)
MFRLILLTAREIDRTGDWTLPLSYFAFWTVRLGGWLPRFDRCSVCGTAFGAGPVFFGVGDTGLYCDKCRRGGMRPLHAAGRRLAERFASQSLDKLTGVLPKDAGAGELREVALNWIEHHTERKLHTRGMLETN